MLLPINEVFYSLQGEGWWTGRAAVFVRVEGCNLRCSWCDSKNAQEVNPSHRISIDQVVERVKGVLPKSFPNVYQDKLFVVITGGEPALYPEQMKSLTRALRAEVYGDIYIAVETNGILLTTEFRRLFDWVTVSPKPELYDYLNLFHHPDWAGDELKLVLSPDLPQYVYNSLKMWPEFLRGRFGHFYIQPCSEDNARAVEFVKENSIWRLSLQTHKAMNIR